MTPEYSSRVALWLQFGGQRVAVSQVGDTSLLLCNPLPIPANQYGRIIVSVDGDDQIYPVVIRAVSGREVRFEQTARSAEAELQGTLF